MSGYNRINGRAFTELPAWFRQMKAALKRPANHGVIDNHADLARMVDRGVSEIMVKFGGPRI